MSATSGATMCLVAAMLLLAASDAAQAQNGPPTVFDGPVYFTFPLLTNYPPLSTGMPYDVLRGYIGFDSIARHAGRSDVARMLKYLTYSDTARYAARFLYELTDDDPVTFFQWLNTGLSANMYPNIPAYLRRRLTGVLDTIAPPSLNVVPLLAADYILHIRVTDTQSKIDTTASLARSAQLVTAYVIDTIKGKIIPICTNARFKISNVPTMLPAHGACVTFDYRLEWRRLNHSAKFSSEDSTLIDADGKPWVKPNTEYIVFLSFLNLLRDGQYNYGTLTPVVGWGTAVCMYPVIGGKVSDPHDDFGFGTGLTPAQFKVALRNNIRVLTHL